MQSPGSTPRADQRLNLVRRSIVACNRCRSRKTKCAGTPPYACVACRNSRQTCTYPSSEKKITIPESYFLELRAIARASKSQPDETHLESAGESPVEGQWALAETGNWFAGDSGQYHYVGNSSSNYIANSINPTTETLAWHLHPHYSDFSWIRRDVDPTLPPLPPYEHAKRLYRAQHGYLGTIFSFVRDVDFHHRLERLYSRPPNVSDRDDCLVYCQMLLVFGFGQMYSVNQWVGDDGPPGFVYFKHALKFLPDAYEDGSVLFVEVLSYVAYFLQSLNRRDSAYIYIGLALRMAISLGLHQEVVDQAMGPDERERRRRVWWSVYSMDRLLSLTSGRPFSIQDADINLVLPSRIGDEDPRVSSILACYAQLSKIQGTIGEEIYRKKQTSGKSLFTSIHRIIKSLSEWFRDLPEDLRINTSSAPTGLSRGIISTQLHYYHCINMTVRPLLLYAVQRQMAANNGPSSHSIWEDGIQSSIMSVIDTSIAAARSSMALWKMAAEYNLVATYGFIDGEQAFSNALLLVMINIAFPYKDQDASAMNAALTVLQGMAEKGNRYIQACHSLLVRISSSRTSILPANTQNVEAGSPPNRTETVLGFQNDGPMQAIDTAAGMDCAVNDSLGLSSCDDPELWTEVLNSIGIDMDRQWIESTLLRE